MDSIQLSSDDEGALVCLALYLTRKRRRRHVWTSPWLLRRQQLGAFNNLSRELRSETAEAYKNFLRMEPHHFDVLVQKVSPFLPERENTNMRACLSKAERIELTLRFLAAGGTYTNLSYLYRISRHAIGKIIPETCVAIYEALKADYMKIPAAQADWEKIANDFEEKWQFPNCLGAMDGKHIALKAPAHSGSNFFNYKHFHSIVLLAVVDAHYRFIMFDIGVNGRNSDAAIFQNSLISTKLESGGFPQSKAPAMFHKELPYVIVADEAFPLKQHLMKPFPHRGLTHAERIFNYRLSRARRVSENAFGILINRFSILATRMQLEPATATDIAIACLALQNFLRTEADVTYAEHVDNGHTWPLGIGQQGGNRSATTAQATRLDFCDYFNTVGAVPWQENIDD